MRRLFFAGGHSSRGPARPLLPGAPFHARVLTALSAFVLSLLFAAPALAGGWAVTTLDSLPPDIHAAQSYAIGYTIRQHGITPVNVEQMGTGSTTEIQVTSPDGAKTLRYKGTPEGATGHYVAKVIFPYEGTWKWQVTQGAFQAQDLGPIKIVAVAVAADTAVQPAPVAAAAAANAPAAPQPQPAGPNALVVIALLLASAGAAVLFGSRLAVFADRRATA